MAQTPPSVPANSPYDGVPFGNPNTFTAFPNGLIIAGVVANAVTALLTSAQLLALQSTAIQLVVAPPTPPKGFGVKIVLVPSCLMLQYKFNTTAYTIGNADNAFQIEYTGKATNLVKTNATGLVDQVSSQFVSVLPAVAGTIISQANSGGLGLEVKLVGTAPALTLGDGTVYLTLQYDEVVMQ